MFLFKKIVGPLFFPLSLCLEFFLLGLALLWFTRKQRPGRLLFTLGVFLLLLLSFRPIPSLLLEPLEQQYPVLTPTRIRELAPPGSPQSLQWIVVLGGGVTPDPRLPAASQLSETSLIRLIEAIRLQRALPGTRIILSGGSPFGSVPEAEVMGQVAAGLGVATQDLVLEPRSRDTEDQARLIKEMVGPNRFLLVTSAVHLPRAVALFRRQGLDPLPCPVGHQVKKLDALSPTLFFPHAEEIGKAEAACYEYLGWAWARLKKMAPDR